MLRKTIIHLWLSGLFSLAVLFLSTTPANAYPGGVSGYSGKSGSTCTSCHSTGTKPTVTISGPTSVTSGSTNSYTLTVSGGGNGGLDVASTGGTFTAGSTTQVMGGEITHTTANSTHSWTFSWTAPTVTTNTTHTMYGAAIDGSNGGTGTATLATTVTAPATKPNLQISPSSMSFSYQTGGATPAAQSISVASSGAAVTYTVSASGGSWLSATGGGSTPGSISVSVNPGSMAAGTYNGSVTITSTGAANSPQTVPVTLTITAAAPKPNLQLSPSSLNFSYQIGGSNPAAQSVSVGSSGSALTYSASASGGSWLSATGSGSTPGSVSVSVNASSLAAGTYNGSVSIASSGAGNTPQSVPVTLTVTAATNPKVTANPSSLKFAYTVGGSNPGAQSFSVGSSGGGLTYSISTSGGSWLSATGGGNTPGSVNVAVNASSMSAGTYNGSVMISASGASNSPMTVPVTLTVTSSGGGGGGSGSLSVRPSRLTFYSDGRDPAPQNIAVTSTGSAMSFTAEAFGGSWMSLSASGGNTPYNLGVDVSAAGLPPGTYSGVVQIKAGTSSKYVEVVLVVGGSSWGGGGGGHDDGNESEGGTSTRSQAQPFSFDPGAQNNASATWQNANSGSRGSQTTTASSLVLTKRSSGPTTAIAGALITGSAGSTVNQLGFDLMAGSTCTQTAPEFVVITNDDVVHRAGCSQGQTQQTNTNGWRRVSFNPSDSSQFSPAIQEGAVVKTIALVMDRIGRNGTAVLSNISVNGTAAKNN